jgi:hypothetical protein
MIDIAEEAGRNSGRAELIGRVRGMQAVCRQLQGRWLESVRMARESQELQRRCATQVWDYAIMIWWEMLSAAFAGQVGELVTKVPEALRDAEGRGDVFGATSFRTHRCCWAWLGMDRPEVADGNVDIAEREWNPDGYQFQHWHMSYARSEVDLYNGTPRRSFERVLRDWHRGHLLRQVGGVRSDMLYTRARLALSSAIAAPQASLIKRALADGRALIAQGAPWTIALGHALLAQAASFERRDVALCELEKAERLFAAADMALHVEVMRVRRGQLMGDRTGDELAASGLRQIHALGAKRPERFVDMLAPVKLTSARSSLRS